MRKWLRRLFSLSRITREVALLPYIGQPVQVTSRGLVIRPRTSLTRRWRLKRTYAPESTRQ